MQTHSFSTPHHIDTCDTLLQAHPMQTHSFKHTVTSCKHTPSSTPHADTLLQAHLMQTPVAHSFKHISFRHTPSSTPHADTSDTLLQTHPMQTLVTHSFKHTSCRHTPSSTRSPHGNTLLQAHLMQTHSFKHTSCRHTPSSTRSPHHANTLLQAHLMQTPVAHSFKHISCRHTLLHAHPMQTLVTHSFKHPPNTLLTLPRGAVSGYDNFLPTVCVSTSHGYYVHVWLLRGGGANTKSGAWPRGKVASYEACLRVGVDIYQLHHCPHVLLNPAVQ